MTCTTHHYACPCREAKFAEMEKILAWTQRELAERNAMWESMTMLAMKLNSELNAMQNESEG